MGLLLLCEVALGDMNELLAVSQPASLSICLLSHDPPPGRQADYYAAEAAKKGGKLSTFGTHRSDGPLAASLACWLAHFLTCACRR